MRRLIAVLPVVAGCDVLFQLRHLDPPPSEPPHVIATGVTNCNNCSSQTLSFTAVAGRPSTLLLVSIAASGGTSAPPITSVTYGPDPLSFILRGTSTASTTRPNLEQWQLLEPVPGEAPVTVTLGGAATALLVGVAQIEGTRDVDPVRASAAAGSAIPSLLAENTVESADLDLVVDSICGGTSVDVPAMDQTVLYVRNLSSNFSCGNLGSSVTMGGTPNVALHWNVNSGNPDHWIDLATSIAPGP